MAKPKRQKRKQQIVAVDYSKAKEYHKKNTIKKFFQYKLMELGIIPLSILSIWKLPLWTGWAFIKIFGIDADTTMPFCKFSDDYGTTACTGTGPDSFIIWFFGGIILFLLLLLVYVNWNWAKKKSLAETAEKFKVPEEKLEEEEVDYSGYM